MKVMDTKTAEQIANVIKAFPAMHFELNKRRLFTKEEYDTNKKHREIPNCSVGPSYTEWGDIYGSPIIFGNDKLTEKLNDFIGEQLFDVRGDIYFGTYMKGCTHYFYVLMTSDNGETKAFEYAYGVS